MYEVQGVLHSLENGSCRFFNGRAVSLPRYAVWYVNVLTFDRWGNGIISETMYFEGNRARGGFGYQWGCVARRRCLSSEAEKPRNEQSQKTDLVENDL